MKYLEMWRGGVGLQSDRPADLSSRALTLTQLGLSAEPHSYWEIFEDETKDQQPLTSKLNVVKSVFILDLNRRICNTKDKILLKQNHPTDSKTGRNLKYSKVYKILKW